MREYLEEFIHPKTSELYKKGDRVCIYQGRFGHNNIIVINTIFKIIDDPHTNIYVSEESDSESGTYTSAIKEKISDKRLEEIEKARRLSYEYKHK